MSWLATMRLTGEHSGAYTDSDIFFHGNQTDLLVCQGNAGNTVTH